MEEVVRFALLDDDAAVHHHHHVRHFQREFDFVGDDDHRPAFRRQLLDGVQHFLHQLGVERRGGFVKEHQFGADGERAGDADALLLPARELPGVMFASVGEADFFQQVLGVVARFIDRPALDDDRPFHDVFPRGFVREEVVVLEDHAGFAAQGEDVFFARFAGEVDGKRRGAVEGDRPRFRHFQRVQAAEEGGFAAAGGAEDDDDAAFGDVEVDAVQDGVVAEGFVDVADGEHVIWRCSGRDGAPGGFARARGRSRRSSKPAPLRCTPAGSRSWRWRFVVRRGRVR